MEKHLSFTWMPSLEQMTLRRIAIALYNESGVLASIATMKLKPCSRYINIWQAASEYGYASNVNEWLAVESRMLRLELPKALAKQMRPILKAVLSDIFLWKMNHEVFFDSSVSRRRACLQKLRWSPAGAVDYRKTAEALVVLRGVLGIAERFELACLYCLEDYIPLLWQQLPDENKKSFSSSPVETPHLNSFLPYIIKKHPKRDVGEISGPMTAPRLFRISAGHGHRALTEYCFRKLTKEEREASLLPTAKALILSRVHIFSSDARRKNLSDVVCYLLSLMTPEERMKIFKPLPGEVLMCFLDWPWQDLFLDLADAVWPFLTGRKELTMVDLFVSFRHSGYYFPKLFQNSFLRMPIRFRKHFLRMRHVNECLFEKFFRMEDTETMEVIFRNIDASDRMELVSSEGGLLCIEEWAHKWHLVEVFLREARLTEENKKKLKQSFTEFQRRRKSQYRNSDHQLYVDYRRFFEFVQGSDASAGNKRSSKDITVVEAKKLCLTPLRNSFE